MKIKWSFCLPFLFTLWACVYGLLKWFDTGKIDYIACYLILTFANLCGFYIGRLMDNK